MKSLIDSNVLIRTIDAKPTPYSAEAIKVLKKLAGDGTGVVSAQSLYEFAHYALVERRLEPWWVESQVKRLTTVFPVLPITETVVKKALNVMSTQPMGYFDAQVWATAKVNGVGQVVTEGLWHKLVREKVLYYDLLRQVPTIGWGWEV